MKIKTAAAEPHGHFGLRSNKKYTWLLKNILALTPNKEKTPQIFCIFPTEKHVKDLDGHINICYNCNN
ncbi:hypothetical protein DWV16_07610 [Anaerotruncus sp. AF02-27]|nr:hypothetical protein DWV16_07610 [Anaerotruncus sp. AF02-27]